ncbi:MAG: AlkA N-terminal domain-containing protein [Nocardioides sp.]|nr:AlkA N-terminal domain-containing protein [Nocardioides sp.]
MDLDATACYRAVRSRDRRFDGVFWTGVRTTGIYCRPSCPARTPRECNVTFHPTAAAAHAAGYRACRRCLPDATPGSPRWDLAADVAGRAMRLVADGTVDREGVEGLARRLGFSTRHLNRLLVGELGAGPLALARAHRAQTARVLVESSDLPFVDVAFAAGFRSVRQFNETVREVYAATPSQLRATRRRGPGGPGVLEVALGVRRPFAAGSLLRFLAASAVPGLEVGDASSYARVLRLPHGTGTVHLRPADDRVVAAFRLADLRDVGAAVERVRRLLDADADPEAIDAHLGADPLLEPRVRRLPGLRVPGHVDGFEALVRTVLGQQVSVASGRGMAARLLRDLGTPVTDGAAPDDLTHAFPDAETLAAADPGTWAMTRTRARTLHEVATRVAEGDLDLHRGTDRAATRAALLGVHGIGPWTVDGLALRVWGDPDVLLPTDLGTRQALRALGHDDAPRAAEHAGERWRPWRSYAQVHLWHCVFPPEERIDPCGP